MPPRGVRPRGLRELTFLARTASALGFFLLSTTPLAIQSQLAANAETGPAIDPIQTAALAVEIVPESVSRDANADLPMVEAYRARPSRCSRRSRRVPPRHRQSAKTGRPQLSGQQYDGRSIGRSASHNWLPTRTCRGSHRRQRSTRTRRSPMPIRPESRISKRRSAP